MVGYLGHRGVSATATYARVQLDALREVGEIEQEGLSCPAGSDRRLYGPRCRPHGAKFFASAILLHRFCAHVGGDRAGSRRTGRYRIGI